MIRWQGLARHWSVDVQLASGRQTARYKQSLARNGVVKELFQPENIVDAEEEVGRWVEICHLAGTKSPSRRVSATIHISTFPEDAYGYSIASMTSILIEDNRPYYLTCDKEGPTAAWDWQAPHNTEIESPTDIFLPPWPTLPQVQSDPARSRGHWEVILTCRRCPRKG